MDKNIILLLVAIGAVLYFGVVTFDNGAIGLHNPFEQATPVPTVEATTEPEAVLLGCPYEELGDGTVNRCYEEVCRTDESCGDQGYSYRECDPVIGLWGLTKYTDESLTLMCEDGV